MVKNTQSRSSQATMSTPVKSKQDLLNLLAKDKDAHLAFLSSLIRIPTPNPPGDTRDAIAFVEQHLQKHGISSEIIAPKPDAPNLVSTFHAEGPSEHPRNLVFNGHIDIFPVNADEKWQRDPYSGDVDGDFVHGRGAVDMKAGTAADIIAFSYLHRFRSQLSGRCTLEVVSDEETGGRYGTRYLLERDGRKETWKGDCVLNAEPGGVESIRFGERGSLRMTFEVRCEGAHGAFMHLSEGAIRIASRLIARLAELENLPPEGMDPELRKYLQREDVRNTADGIMGPGAAAYMLKPSVNIGTIRGGVKVNMIPSYCVFEADIRLPIGLVKETVLARIDEVLRSSFPEASYTVQEAATNPPAASSVEHEMVELLQRNAKLVRGEAPVSICSLGGTDCKHFRYNGVPAYCYGPSPTTMAAVDERVKAQEFLDIIKIHTLAAWEYLGGPI
ncbi:acetylornithine deacetylase/succinyldiaminopimelate desuccinylase-like deacylase [Neohortaea acidophila]|uniref:Acetylornithine deacetylase/succinyldiaminopimelate desuccinylase-like deacylase n=1 Tax=Neohortaea acidophila TaxID=245834 RepID=A0A6A6Q1J2_9PEZI|nr:acetylornithine deacetylase/succinyldiaminopimelate desuccinylase-like deacylase [Neohortaea acidophila]KAF2485849.1 acetylornithine deacetylase/succinyldiaminopimelate desuccinylase-like deacylase [Neohortaea acidophila]